MSRSLHHPAGSSVRHSRADQQAAACSRPPTHTRTNDILVFPTQSCSAEPAAHLRREGKQYLPSARSQMAPASTSEGTLLCRGSVKLNLLEGNRWTEFGAAHTNQWFHSNRSSDDWMWLLHTKVLKIYVILNCTTWLDSMKTLRLMINCSNDGQNEPDIYLTSVYFSFWGST